MVLKPRDRLAFTPLRLSLEQKTIWLVALIGLALSWAALWIIEEQLNAHKRLDFEWVAKNRTRAVEHGIQTAVQAMASVRDLMLVNPEAEQRDFRVFSRSVLGRNPGIHALAWIPAPRDISSGYAVTHMESSDSRHSGDTAQMNSDPVLRRVLERARASGALAVSPGIDLVGSDVVLHGIFAVIPVYRDASDADPSAVPRESLMGFVVGFLQIDDLINNAIALLEPRGVDIRIADESGPEADRLLYYYASRLRTQTGAAVESDSGNAARTSSSLLNVGDRQWSITSIQTPQFRSAEAFEETPWVVLLAGLVFTLLLSFYLARIRENMREREAMQHTLVEREELFRHMTETVNEVFWATDATGSKTLYLSPAYARIWGGQPDPAAGLPLFQSLEEPIARDQLLGALRGADREPEGTEMVYRIARPDQTTRWVRTRCFPVHDASGTMVRIVGFTEDITETKLAEEELRDSEQKLRALFNQSPDLIMTVNRYGEILLVNRSTPDMPVEQAVGHSSEALFPQEFHKWYAAALDKVFRKGKKKNFEYSTTDGKYWQGRIVPLKEKGIVSAAMVIATDVTARRQLEQKALQNARLASIGILAAGVAHEINNPNNSIRFSTSVLRKVFADAMPIIADYREQHGELSLGGLEYTELRETVPQLLQGISDNSQRIGRIVDNLKHMAKRDSADLTQDVSIYKVLEAATMLLHNQIQKHTDAWSLELAPGLPPVRGNRQQLEQVAVNLILNALQALPDRSRGVRVSAGLNPDGRHVMLTVQDEGVGIPEEHMKRLTEPFFTTRGERGGTGLGLSISHSIIERHGGTIAFEPGPESGAIVTVTLPVAEPVEENPHNDR